MTENNKGQKLGMSKAQLGILIGLAIFAVILIVAIAGLFLSRKGIGFSRPPATPPVARSTPTMIVIPTFTPTQTPTPVPYEERIPEGWKQFKTELIEIWFPSNFKLADADKLAKDARKRYEEMGLQELIDYNEQSEAIIDLGLVDEESGSALYRTVASISYEPLTEASLDDYVKKEVAKLPSMMSLVEQRKVQIGSDEAIKLVYELRVGSLSVNDLEYIFLDGSTVWIVGYFAEINEFYQQLPTFEQSIQTFRIIR
jgi:hypothetical protein